MDELEKQVRRARWRLGVERFCRTLGWCWFGTLLAAVILIVAGKFLWREVSAEVWLAVGLGGSLALALMITGGWIFFTRRGPLRAAIEIDHRFGLKERVSSTLAMPQADLQTEAGQALVHDAVRRVERIDVGSKFTVRPGRPLLLPLIPAVAALLVAFLINPSGGENPATAETTTKAAVKKQIKKSSDALKRKLAERRKKADEKGLKDAEKLFKQLEVGTDDLSAKQDRKKALVKLNDLASKLEARRKALGGAEEVKQQLNQMKNIDRGPAEKVAKEIARGNFDDAAKELEKLKEQMAQGNMNEEQKQQMAKQMEQMQQKLNKMNQAHQEAMEQMKKQIEKLQQAGQNAQANQLQQQLDQLQQQLPQMQQMQQMAQQMGQCAKCLRDGQLQQAMNQMGNMQAQLDNLQQQLDEMEMLDDAMQQLAQCRDQMNCKQCGGMGCEACQGQGFGQGFGQGDGNGQGDGLGRGQGKGARPEEEDQVQTFDSHVKQQIGTGAAIVVGEADGPNVKGNVQEMILQKVEEAQRGSTDPVSGQRLPRRHQEHARQYFDSFREGE